MIDYTIEAAVKSDVCYEIFVSTDSQEIAKVAEAFGAIVPYLRPPSLAQDNTQMIEVIKYTLLEYEKNNNHFDIFLYLQPTSPLRNAIHITKAFELFFSKEADTIVSVHRARCVKERLNTIPENLNMGQFVQRRSEYQNRQDLEEYYELNGAIHIARWDVLKDKLSWYVRKSFAYVLDDPYWLDIDDKLDFDFAEFLIQSGKVNNL